MMRGQEEAVKIPSQKKKLSFIAEFLVWLRVGERIYFRRYQERNKVVGTSTCALLLFLISWNLGYKNTK